MLKLSDYKGAWFLYFFFLHFRDLSRFRLEKFLEKKFYE